jgi:ketosteroid isomerase-like protein
MTHTRLLARLLAIALLLITGSHLTVLIADEIDTVDDAKIRSARHAFNQAIREKDVDAIEHFFAPEYHIITGRSQQSHGIEAERDLWQSIFDSDPGFYCQRDIRELRINSDWGLAEELGNWNCYFTGQGQPVHASGVYAAKWQRNTDHQWLIQSEVFTTMNCVGNETGCMPPDAIEH